MFYYLRLFNKENWNFCEDILELPGNAVCKDWTCCNNGASNTWSVFKFDHKPILKDLDSVVIFLLCKNISFVINGAHFLYLPESMLDEKFIFPDEECFGAIHANYKNVNVKKLKILVKYCYYSNAQKINILEVTKEQIYVVISNFFNNFDNIEKFLKVLEVKKQSKIINFFDSVDNAFANKTKQFGPIIRKYFNIN